MLVKGYAVWNKERAGQDSETLYAITEDGRIFVTGPHRVTVEFDAPARVWNRTYDAMPEAAEFIGHYPMPKNIGKFA